VFLGRWTAFLRAVMPGLAGLSQLRYRTFLLWNALGGIVWGVTFSLVGYFAGASYQKVAATIGRDSAIVLAVVVVAVLLFWHFRRERGEESA
jgi:membrane protein DedA with SNARE-associated domain